MVRAREEARTIAEQGLAKMDAGDFAAAARLLEVAEQRFHAPTHLLFLGQAYTGLGRLAKAASMYRRLLSEQVPNYAPDAFREAQVLGKKELAALEPRVPQVALELDRDPALVELTVDGEKVAFESPLWLDPGDHVLSATAGGVTKIEKVSAREAERLVVRFAFGRADAPPPEGPAGRGLGPLALGASRRCPSAAPRWWWGQRPEGSRSRRSLSSRTVAPTRPGVTLPTRRSPTKLACSATSRRPPS